MEIKSYDVDRWSDPDEHHRVRHIGMAKWGEVFTYLKAALDERGLLPDEYFLCEADSLHRNRDDELPDYEFAECIPNYGSSEGIYLDISLVCLIEGRRQRVRFATGKTLDESVDAFFHMALAAAVSSLILNGRGCHYKSEGAVVELDKDEKSSLAAFLKQNLDLSSEKEKSDFEKIISKLGKGAQSQSPVQAMQS